MSAEKIQSGGNHYKKMAIQPMRFSMENGLDACQHTAIKYIARFRDKGGIADLEKAKHTIDLLIMFEVERKDREKPTADEWDKAEERQVAVDQNGNDGAVYSEYTLAEVIGDAVLSDWARWLTIDPDGRVFVYSKHPEIIQNMWVDVQPCRVDELKQVVAPLNFRNCIWKIDKTIKPS